VTRSQRFLLLAGSAAALAEGLHLAAGGEIGSSRTRVGSGSLDPVVARDPQGRDDPSGAASRPFEDREDTTEAPSPGLTLVACGEDHGLLLGVPVEIEVLDPSGDVASAATVWSGAGGRIEIPAPRLRGGRLRARYARGSGLSGELLLDSRDLPGAATVALRAGYRGEVDLGASAPGTAEIVIRVTDTAGRPVSGAFLAAHAPGLEAELGTALTDSAGEGRLRVSGSGVADVVVSAPGAPPLRARSLRAEESPHAVTVAMQAGIEAVVSFARTGEEPAVPIPMQVAVVPAGASPEGRFRTYGDHEGRLRWVLPAEGELARARTLDLHLRAQGYLPAQIAGILPWPSGSRPALLVHLEAAPFRIAGRLVREDSGEPVAGAALSGPQGEPAFATASGKDGLFEVPLAEPRAVELEVKDPRYLPRTVRIEAVPVRGGPPPRAIPLVPAGLLEVRLEAPRAGGVRLRAGAFAADWVLDASGTARGPVPAGTVEVEVQGTGEAPSAPRTVRVAEGQTTVLVIGAASDRARLLGEVQVQGRPAADVLLAIHLAGRPEALSVRSDSRGSFVLDGLVPGPARIEATLHHEGRRYRGTVELVLHSGDNPATIRLALVER
jgi:hypothetical protein